MLTVKKEGVLLHKTNFLFENEGVLNPAAILEGDVIHLFYRAVHKGNNSSIGYAKLSDPLTIESRMNRPILFPENDFEKHGVEDPRITKIDDQYFLTYTAYDGVNALGALAVSKDLVNFEKRGIIVPQVTYSTFKNLTEHTKALNSKYVRYNSKNKMLWDKNVIFFPRRINGKLYFLHRIRPDIQLASVNNIEDLTAEFWKNYFLNFRDNILLESRHDHEISYIGGGCPPIETEYGWLLIYHGVHDTRKGYVYAACAALLDLENPLKEIARLPYALFKPELDWELKGEVNNVCFPTGAVVVQNILYIYYGAADERVACASVNLQELINELLLNKI